MIPRLAQQKSKPAAPGSQGLHPTSPGLESSVYYDTSSDLYEAGISQLRTGGC